MESKKLIVVSSSKLVLPEEITSAERHLLCEVENPVEVVGKWQKVGGGGLPPQRI